MVRLPLLLFLVALALVTSPVQAQSTLFDLSGPAITASVTRDEQTLPIARVPGLRAGDRLTLKADLPPDQEPRYLLVVAFLRGATTPPLKKWFFRARTWKRGKDVLSVAVPEGAEQAIAFLAPDGSFDSVVNAVRGRPGVFVRAAQDLHQASLDRARLETFVAGIARIEESAPERLDTVSPVLASALAMRLNPECLTRQQSVRAACLTQNRENLVLQTTPSGTTVADRLTGAPIDLAYRIAATKEGGAGFYSPYIGLARDLVRLFGAFRSTQYQYLPALGVGRGDALQLRLNTPPSFTNPQSVLVASLPPIGAATPPAWRPGAKSALCLGRSDLVLPVENAPLLYATGYAADLSLRLTTADGNTVNLPVSADAERGGVVVAGDGRPSLAGTSVTGAVLQGRWGFERFEGPRFAVSSGAPAAWALAPDASVVVGRDHPLVLRGGAPACVAQLTLRDAGGQERAVEWKATGPAEITVILPLTRARPGKMTLLIAHSGSPAPAALDFAAHVEASRLDRFVLHEGDGVGTLSGARLDQVAELRLGDVRFAPGELTRGPDGDRLVLSSGEARAALPAGETRDAAVRLRDGRSATVRARIAQARPRIALVSRQVEAAPQAGRLAILMPEETLSPDALLTFSAKTESGRFEPGDSIEVATEDGSASALLSEAKGGLQRVGGDVAIGTLRPQEALGVGAVGPLRFRLVRGEAVGDWQKLATVVRLPVLDGLACPAAGKDCTLTGSRLFLLTAIADNPEFARPLAVPPGFVGSRIAVPRPKGTMLYLRLHDAPDAVMRAALRGRGE